MVIASGVLIYGDAMDISIVPGSVLMMKETVHNNVHHHGWDPSLVVATNQEI